MPGAYSFLTDHDIKSGIVPLDLQTARTGDYISLKNAGHLTIVLFKAAGTAGDDPVLTFNQATDVAGTGAKALTVAKHYQQQGTLSSVTGWSEVTQTASATVNLNATSAENQGIYVFEFDASDLDADGGFDCVSMDVGDVGNNAQLGSAFYILSKIKYGGKPQNHTDPLVD